MPARVLASQPPEGYKLSRAALREKYGSRSIDASAPQSAQDQTPSGRQKYLEQQNIKVGMKPQIAANAAADDRNQEWNRAFPFKVDTSNLTPNLPLQDAIPAPRPLGLLPQTPGPEMLASFLPPTTSPLTGFSSPAFKGSLLRNPNKWRVSSFG